MRTMLEENKVLVSSEFNEIKEESSNKEKKYVFHVVNSVKGGCGKSTFALWLAEHYRKKCESVYIIDLDTAGTSWYDDYKKCITSDYDYIFFNDILIDYKKIYSLNPWRPINSKMLFTYKKSWEDLSEIEKKKTIYACLSDPSRRITKLGYEIDLFEQAVEQLLKSIIILEGNNEDTVHVILDMAPGYDEKSERIFFHWLITNKFLLFKGKEKANYEVRLYMMSNVLYSSINSTIEYINELIKPIDYGSVINDLMNNHKFRILLSFNDVNNYNITTNSSTLLKRITGRWWTNIDRSILSHIMFDQIPYTHAIPFQAENFNVIVSGSVSSETATYPETEFSNPIAYITNSIIGDPPIVSSITKLLGEFEKM